ncbi:hypothetical protein QL285_056923 [Trifolium repens]|nr:hypothetical protein QL285_056923 [Trifolium repens]
MYGNNNNAYFGEVIKVTMSNLNQKAVSQEDADMAEEETDLAEEEDDMAEEETEQQERWGGGPINIYGNNNNLFFGETITVNQGAVRQPEEA